MNRTLSFLYSLLDCDTLVSCLFALRPEFLFLPQTGPRCREIVMDMVLDTYFFRKQLAFHSHPGGTIENPRPHKKSLNETAPFVQFPFEAELCVDFVTHQTSCHLPHEVVNRVMAAGRSHRAGALAHGGAAHGQLGMFGPWVQGTPSAPFDL